MAIQISRRAGIWLAASASTLLLSACGSDSNDDNPTTPTGSAPEAAEVTVEVSTKQLTLSWAEVEGATEYQVYRDRDGTSGFTSISGPIADTSYSLPVSVHLTNWGDERFIVEACNIQGCTPSQEIHTKDLALEAIGYLKAGTNSPESLFGFSIAVSHDGNTIAVGAPQHDYKAEALDIERSGAVFIYNKNADKEWALQAEIFNPAQAEGAWDLFGYSLALSKNGDKLLIGAPSEDGPGDSVNADIPSEAGTNSGAAYLYELKNDSWIQDTYFKASNADREDYFGLRVAMTPDASKIAISAPYEASNSSGVNGDQEDNTVEMAGAVYLFERTTTSWQQTEYIKPSTPSYKESFCFNPRPPNSGACYAKTPSRFGYGLAFSHSGDALAIGAPGDNSSSPGINGNEEDYRAKSSGAVHILRLTDGEWILTDYIKASNPGNDDEFGYSLSLSGDGNTLVVGSPYEDSLYSGNYNNQELEGLSFDSDIETEQDSGAAYVFLYDGTNWHQTNYIKAQHPDEDDLFGFSVSINEDGKLIAVGSPRDDSEAKGVSNFWDNSSAPSSGAAYIYYQQETTSWDNIGYIKASNTDPNDTFGRTLILTADGETLIVGATGEDSQSTGSSGDQDDDTGEKTGALYLY